VGHYPTVTRISISPIGTFRGAWERKSEKNSPLEQKNVGRRATYGAKENPPPRAQVRTTQGEILSPVVEPKPSGGKKNPIAAMERRSGSTRFAHGGKRGEHKGGGNEMEGHRVWGPRPTGRKRGEEKTKRKKHCPAGEEKGVALLSSAQGGMNSAAD